MDASFFKYIVDLIKTKNRGFKPLFLVFFGIELTLSVLGTTAALFTGGWQRCNAGATTVKAINGERHCSEQLAGIGVSGCGVTFLIWNAIVGCLNEKLCISLYSHGRKDTEGYENTYTVFVAAYLTVNTSSDIVGNFTTATAAALLDLCAEHDRLNNLNNCFGLADATVKRGNNRAIASVSSGCVRGYVAGSAE